MFKICGLALAASFIAGPALAQVDLFSEGTVSGFIDVRAATADGETSWTGAGFGKTRFGHQTSGTADAMVEWRPKLAWSLSGVADLMLQSDLEDKVGLNEAYLLYRPLGAGKTHFQARAGLFYPPVSMEHDGKAWSLTRTITPSAINSWISEEVNETAVEVSLKREFGGHEVGLTVGGFDKNDTAGTLLSFRGWALGDVRANLNGEFELPPLSAFIQTVQPSDTYPLRELDDRFGYYIRADWRPPAPISFNATYYDNLGDMIAVDADGQWSWYTRFVNVGLDWTPAENTEVMAQAMIGVTRMGFPFPVGRWVNVDFDSAYLLATQTFGANAVTGRLDYFRINDQANALYGNLSETGWAVTADYRRALSSNAQLFLEVLHVDSDRASRAYAGLPARQQQTTFQALARFSF
ncbi:hypothetical protein BH11PSE2_BH11PSE2_05470 [soil metagenome]